MANIPETATYVAAVYQLATTDPVQGGAVVAGTGGGGADHIVGLSNLQASQLANRTKWLYDKLVQPADAAPGDPGKIGALWVDTLNGGIYYWTGAVWGQLF